MHPIYTAAAFTSLLGVCAFFGVLWQSTSPLHRRSLAAVWALALVMSPAAFYLVRQPLLSPALTPTIDAWTKLGGWPLVFADILRLSFAPLTEEPAKLVPWLLVLGLGWPVPPAKTLVVPIACAVGFGFATGEMWLVARLIDEQNAPHLRNLPWFAFGGYASERLLTCVTHALFALPTLWWSRRGWGWAVAGLAVGMLLHFFGNAPIMLLKRDVGALGPAVWGAIVQLWVSGFALVGVFVLAGVHLGPKLARRALQGRMICPECGAEYRQSRLMGLNMGTWRYEQCGVCHKWHWVTLKNLAPLRGRESSATRSVSKGEPPATPPTTD